MAEPTAASIVIPTRTRASYLEIALASIVPQAQAVGAEVIVVSDGADLPTEAVVHRHRVRMLQLPRGSGANAARNAGAAAARGELLVFVDDDVEAPPGWLEAILAGARGAPGHGVLGGPIVPRLEGTRLRGCGREPAPITSLDLGAVDRDAPLVWSANMAIRRQVLEQTGPFDETIRGRGEEEEWQRRYTAAGGRIRYLAAAGLAHRRNRDDSRLIPLGRAAYALGRTARRYDVRKGEPPTVRAELVTLAGCGWHTARRFCAFGVVMAAHSAGRLREALAPVPPGPRPGEDFLSGSSGHVAGIRATGLALVADAVADLVQLPRRPSLNRAAARWPPPRSVLVLAIERPDQPNLLAAAHRELTRSRHHVEFHSTPVAGRGKFENLNALLERHPAAGHDWLIVLDDDVALPRGFLDRFVFLAERFELAIAQPAHRRHSHAAWEVTRRRARFVARETAFVEIGPLTAFGARTFEVLLPFPALKAGWGLDNHWSALARERGWRIGVIDATPIAHRLRPVAVGYDRSGAVKEAREFLAERPYLSRHEANRTLVRHRRP